MLTICRLSSAPNPPNSNWRQEITNGRSNSRWKHRVENQGIKLQISEAASKMPTMLSLETTTAPPPPKQIDTNNWALHCENSSFMRDRRSKERETEFQVAMASVCHWDAAATLVPLRPHCSFTISRYSQPWDTIPIITVALVRLILIFNSNCRPCWLEKQFSMKTAPSVTHDPCFVRNRHSPFFESIFRLQLSTAFLLKHSAVGISSLPT